MLMFSEMVPKSGIRGVIPAQVENRSSIVLSFSLNQTTGLLGGDLENSQDLGMGWKAVITSDVRPEQKAHMFKVPHHGFPNAHCEEVWAQMCVSDVFAVVTPYTSGRTPRPAPDDMQRLLSCTSNLIATAPSSVGKDKNYNTTVQKLLKSTVRKRTTLTGRMGHVQIRSCGNEVRIGIDGAASLVDHSFIERCR